MTSSAETAAHPSRVPTHLLDADPDQPRRHFDPEKLEDLALSVRERGVLMPLLVRQAGERYIIVAGERRWRAAQMAGLESVPVVVRSDAGFEAREVQLIENLQRDDLNDVERTRSVMRHLCAGLGLHPTDLEAKLRRLKREEEGGEPKEPDQDTGIPKARLGRPPVVVSQRERDAIHGVLALLGLKVASFVTNMIPLLRLPEDLQEAMLSRGLEGTKARILSAVKDPERRAALLEEALEQGLTKRQLRERVAAFLPPAPAPVKRSPELERLGTRIAKVHRRLEALSPEALAEVERHLVEIEAALAKPAPGEKPARRRVAAEGRPVGRA